MLCKNCTEAGIVPTVVLGAASKSDLVCKDPYEKLVKKNLFCATDDGSYGHAGFCLEVVNEQLKQKTYDWIACCGPTSLMKLVAEASRNASIPCSVSLEQIMACGIGACLGCTVETAEGNKRVCVDGPIFNADKVRW